MTDSSEQIERVLDRCVRQIQQGEATLDECLARYPAHRAELAEFLPLVVRLGQAPQVTLSAASVRSGRRQLLEQLQPRPRPRWSFRSALPLGWRQGGQPLFVARRLTMAWILVIATAVSLIAGGGVVYAADAAVPGDFLYGLDRAVEEVRLGLARDPEAEFSLQLRFAEERLEEMGKLYAAGDSSNMKNALAAYGESLAAAVRQMASADETDGEKLRLQLAAAAERHEEMFNNLGDQEPDGEQVQIRDRDRDHWCLEESTDLHPVAEGIVETYAEAYLEVYGEELTYADVIGWFCGEEGLTDGAGLGEIMMAINISLLTGEPVADLLAMQDDGMGWGQIMRYYELIGVPLKQGPPEFPGQPEGEPGRKPEEAGPWKEVPMGPGQGDPSQSGQGGQPEGAGPPDVPPGGQPEGAPVGPEDEAPIGPRGEVPLGPLDELPGGQPEGAPVGSPEGVPVGTPEGIPVGTPNESPGTNGGGGQGSGH